MTRNCTKIDTEINELDNSFQDCDINAMNTRSTNKSGDRSLNGSFNRSSSSNSSHNSSFNSRPNYRNKTAIPAAMTTHTTDRVTTETTIETEDTNKIQDMTKETRTTKTGMITIKTETGLTTGDNQNKYQHYRNQP